MLRWLLGAPARAAVTSARVSGTAISIAIVASTSTVSAQSTPSVVEQGHVLELQGHDVVVDLAGSQGARAGDVVEIWRPLKIRHPVTRRLVTDRFHTGTLTLVQVQSRLSLARPQGQLLRPPAPGDIVVLRRAAPTEPPKPQASERPDESASRPEPAPSGEDPPTKAVAPTDPDAARVTELFESLRGADLQTRVERYARFAEENPANRFSPILEQEVEQLRRLARMAGANARDEATPSARSSPPERALAGRELDVGIEISGAIRGAVLHSRNSGEVAYRSTPMAPAGPRYFTARIPGARVTAPVLEYFIEATTASGHAATVVGAGEKPVRVAVDEIPRPTPPAHHDAVVAIQSDYADYNRLRGNDFTWQTEGTFGMRFRDVGVRALGTGFGVYRGVGGTLEDLDELNRSGRRVGLTYGYLETELAFSRIASLIPRAVVGLQDDGITGGAQLHVRIGNDRETNLMIGGEILGGIGVRGITQLELAAFERVPIVLRTEVTNQPAGSKVDESAVEPDDEDADPSETSLDTGELGVRAIVQPGFRVTDELTLALRVSYQGRTINHSGPGLGGAVTYQW